MTLIIAGYNQQHSPFNNYWRGLNRLIIDHKGLFVVADSAITSPAQNSRRTLLNGFRKVYPISIKIWEPSFTADGYFDCYNNINFSSECFVAIAGSTLTAQHSLNIITEHLSQLRIIYECTNNKQGKYKVIQDCQPNPLKKNQHYPWPEHMFISSDYNNIITADEIAQIIEHSINHALFSAKEYKLDEGAIKGMHTDFIVGIHCPTTQADKLYLFEMKTKSNIDGMEVFTNRQEVQKDKVAVIGMKNTFKQGAQEALDEAIKTGISTADALFTFLNMAIDSNRTETNEREIDYPSYLKLLDRGLLIKADTRIMKP